MNQGKEQVLREKKKSIHLSACLASSCTASTAEIWWVKHCHQPPITPRGNTLSSLTDPTAWIFDTILQNSSFFFFFFRLLPILIWIMPVPYRRKHAWDSSRLLARIIDALHSAWWRSSTTRCMRYIYAERQQKISRSMKRLPTRRCLSGPVPFSLEKRQLMRYPYNHTSEREERERLHPSQNAGACN